MECGLCGKVATFVCGGCERIHYCSEECQRSDWNRHMKECLRVGVKATQMTCTQMRREKTRISDPKLFDGVVIYEEVIGIGSFSEVHRGVTSDGRPLAIKATKLNNGELKKITLMEMEVLHLNDPNIISVCMAGFFFKNESTRRYEKFLMSMDLACCDMLSLQKIERTKEEMRARPSSFTPRETKYMAYQIVRSIAYLHSKLINHLDVKLNNFLIVGREIKNDVVRLAVEERREPTFKQVILSDFGFSCGRYRKPVEVRYAESQRFRPPEIIMNNHMTSTHLCDVWAAACVIFEIATGKPLFKVKTQFDLMLEIAKLVGTDALKDRERVPTQSRKWFTSMSLIPEHIKETWNERLFDPLAEHPGLAYMLRRMLEPNPYDRCNIFQVLDDPYFDAKVREVTRLAIPEVLADIIPVRYDETLSVDRSDVMRIFSEMEKNDAYDSFVEYPTNIKDEEIVVMSHSIKDAMIKGEFSPEERCEVFTHALTLIKRALRSKRYTAVSEQHYRATGIAAAIISERYRCMTEYIKPVYEKDSAMWDDIMVAEVALLQCNDFDISTPTSFDFLETLLPPDVLSRDAYYRLLEELETNQFEFSRKLPPDITRLRPSSLAATVINAVTGKTVDMLIVDPRIGISKKQLLDTRVISILGKH